MQIRQTFDSLGPKTKGIIVPLKISMSSHPLGTMIDSFCKTRGSLRVSGREAKGHQRRNREIFSQKKKRKHANNNNYNVEI